MVPQCPVKLNIGLVDHNYGLFVRSLRTGEQFIPKKQEDLMQVDRPSGSDTPNRITQLESNVKALTQGAF